MHKQADSTITSALMGIILAGIIIFTFVQCAVPLLKKQPQSLASFTKLTQSLQQAKPGSNQQLNLVLEEEGSALLFFNQGAQTLKVVDLVFVRPPDCIGNCACNCLNPTLDSTQKAFVCSKATCTSFSRSFFDTRFYDKNAIQNQGYVLENLGGGNPQQILYLEAFGNKLFLLCQQAPCLTSELGHLILFDQVLPTHLDQCKTEVSACVQALQNINQLVDSDYSLETKTGAPKEDQTQLHLLKQKEIIWQVNLPFILCLTDQMQTLQEDILLTWDAIQSKILISDHGPLTNIAPNAERTQACLVYSS